MLDFAISGLFRLERLIDDRDLRSVYMSPCLDPGETPSAASGVRCWSGRGDMVYTVRVMRDVVV